VNDITNAKARLTRAQAKLTGLAAGTPEHVAQEGVVTGLQADVKALEDQQAADNEAFARLNKEDAEIKIKSLEKAIAKKEEIYNVRKADLEFQEKLAVQYEAEKNDVMKSAKDKATAEKLYNETQTAINKI